MSDRYNEEGDQIETDPLFYGLTIPTTLDGSVPVQVIPVIIAISAIPTLFTMNPVWLLLTVPLYMLCYALCMDDPHWFRRFWLYWKTKARTRNRSYWGGSSYSPTGSFRRRRARKHYEV